MKYKEWDKVSALPLEHIIISQEQIDGDYRFIIFTNDDDSFFAIECFDTIKTTYGFTGATIDAIAKEYISALDPNSPQNLFKNKLAELSTKRDAEVYGTFTYNGDKFDCNKAAMENIDKLILGYNFNSNLAGRSWNTSGGAKVVFLTTGDIPNFIKAYLAVTDNAWAKFAMLAGQLQMIDLNSPDAMDLINAIVW